MEKRLTIGASIRQDVWAPLKAIDIAKRDGFGALQTMTGDPQKIAKPTLTDEIARQIRKKKGGMKI